MPENSPSDSNWREIFREEFERRQQPSIEIEFGESDGAKLAPEASKFGGKPFLPTDFVWPPYYCGESSFTGETANRPLAFLLQINLADVAPFDVDPNLPKRGVLSFFYELESLAGLYSPTQGYARVVYVDPAETDAKTFDLPPELDELDESLQTALAAERPLSFQKSVTVPDVEEIEAYLAADLDYGAEVDPEIIKRKITLRYRLGDLYDEERAKFCGSSKDDGRSRLFGWPDVVQHPMIGELVLAANGLTVADFQALPPERQAKIAEQCEDWTLLLQLARDDDGMFGDDGRIYFWIKKDDLKRKNFDAVLMEFQCG